MRKFLERNDNKVFKALLAIYTSPYDAKTKEKLVALIEKMASGSLSLPQAVSLIKDNWKFYSVLVQLRSQPEVAGQLAIKVQTSMLVSEMLAVSEFNAHQLIDGLTLDELYYLIGNGAIGFDYSLMQYAYHQWKSRMLLEKKSLDTFTRLSHQEDFRQFLRLVAASDQLEDLMQISDVSQIRQAFEMFLEGSHLDGEFFNLGVTLRTPAVKMTMARFLADQETSTEKKDYYEKVFQQAKSRIEDISERFGSEFYLREINWFQKQEFIQTFLIEKIERMSNNPKAMVNFFRASKYFIDKEYGLRAFIRAAYIDPLQALLAIHEFDQVREALKDSNDGLIKQLLAIHSFNMPLDLKWNVALLAHEIVNGHLSMEQAAEIGKRPFRFRNALLGIVQQEQAIGSPAIKKYLSTFYLNAVREINRLHDEPDNVRFAVMEEAALNDYYSLIVYGEQEIYTSSFNGILDRMLKKMAAEKVDGYQLLAQADHFKFRSFFRLLTEFGRLNDFLATMSADERAKLLEQFVENLEQGENALEQSAIAADAFSMIKDPVLLNQLQKLVRKQYQRAESLRSRQAVVIYGILSGTIAENAAGDDADWFKAMAGKYPLVSINRLNASRLFNEQGINVQHYFFYNDQDGKNSFENFLSYYKNNPQWRIEIKENYVHLISQGGAKKIEIFANKPAEEDKGFKDISEVFLKRKIYAQYIIHRGHSFHAPRTIDRIQGNAVLVSLGSCGGFRLVADVLKHAPQAHIFSTKGTGSMYVNDPLLVLLNKRILRGQDIYWTPFWEDFQKGTGNGLVKDYTPPNWNMTALFISTYERFMKKDKAMRGQIQKSTGGIDFNAGKLNLQIQNTGPGIKFKLNYAILKQLQNAQGFTPVIIRITPLASVRLFLGCEKGG